MQDLRGVSDFFSPASPRSETVRGDEEEEQRTAPSSIASEESASQPADHHTEQMTQLNDTMQEVPLDKIVVPLGESEGEPVSWQPSTKGSPHLFIVGIPGQGKSWTTMRILCELGKQHVPTLVLDFHGQFADEQEPFARLIHPSVVDAAKGLPFSPFECTTGSDRSGWKATSDALAEIFATVLKLGPMQQEVIFTAIRDAYQAHGFDDEGAQQLEYPTAEEVLRRIVQREQATHTNNVAARCRPLLDMDLFKPVEGTLDLLSSIRQGLVIDLHNLYAEHLQVAAGAFVLRKLYKDMFTWGNAERLRLAIVLDEAHRLARDVTLPKIMKEGRKFGIAVIVASQAIGDFHADIPGNAGTKIIFRVNFPDSKRVAGFIRARQGQDVAEQIERLPVGTAYVQTPEMPVGSVVQMYPLTETG
jgi:DNA phosphorothioation-dependent restriction protein DptH